VWRAVRRCDGLEAVVKTISRPPPSSLLTHNPLAEPEQEVAVLAHLRHPGIVR
jgi:hypothetical protein